MKKLLSILGGIGVGAALAATLAWGQVAPAGATSASVAAALALSSPQQPGAPVRGGGKGAALTVALIRSTADLIKQTPQQVRAALEGGKTLAEVAQSGGSSADAVVAAVQVQSQARLAKAVQKGRITQAQADALLGQLTTKATELMRATDLGQRRADRQAKGQQRAVRVALVRAASQVTGLPVKEISTRMGAGESLTTIVEAAGGTIDAVIDAATVTFRAAAAEVVK